MQCCSNPSCLRVTDRHIYTHTLPYERYSSNLLRNHDCLFKSINSILHVGGCIYPRISWVSCVFWLYQYGNGAPSRASRSEDFKKELSDNMQQETQAIMQVAHLKLLFSTKWSSDLFYTGGATKLLPYEPVGCFIDKEHPRAFPKFIKNYHINENNLASSLAAIIHDCASRVYNDGFWYFGVEYRSQCWTGVNGNMTYNRHGPSENCLWEFKVGSVWTIFVYRFVEGELSYRW